MISHDVICDDSPCSSRPLKSALFASAAQVPLSVRFHAEGAVDIAEWGEENSPGAAVYAAADGGALRASGEVTAWAEDASNRQLLLRAGHVWDDLAAARPKLLLNAGAARAGGSIAQTSAGQGSMGGAATLVEARREELLSAANWSRDMEFDVRRALRPHQPWFLHLSTLGTRTFMLRSLPPLLFYYSLACRPCLHPRSACAQVMPHALNTDMLTWLRLVLASADEIEEASSLEAFRRVRSRRTEGSALSALLVALDRAMGAFEYSVEEDDVLLEAARHGGGSSGGGSSGGGSSGGGGGAGGRGGRGAGGGVHLTTRAVSAITYRRLVKRVLQQNQRLAKGLAAKAQQMQVDEPLAATMAGATRAGEKAGRALGNAGDGDGDDDGGGDGGEQSSSSSSSSPMIAAGIDAQGRVTSSPPPRRDPIRAAAAAAAAAARPPAGGRQDDEGEANLYGGGGGGSGSSSSKEEQASRLRKRRRQKRKQKAGAKKKRTR